MMKTIMIQGTGSHVGKSVIAAAFCRILSDRGLRVVPFKAQNMSLNSFVTPEGGEIGRAQALQAQAARAIPHTDMNPILMKPEEDTRAQIVFRGRSAGSMSVSEYSSFKKAAFAEVLACLERLQKANDVVVIEGAGSPAEINLRNEDIVNMPIADAANASVILVGDIDKGGVFASLTGTLELLESHERNRIQCTLINKFRGDRSLLEPGITFLEQRTGIPVLGVVPYFKHIQLPEEDSVSVEHARSKKGDAERRIRVRVIRVGSMSNFTDFDSLLSEPDIDFAYASQPFECSNADLLILPGSKCTVRDLHRLRESGIATAICERIGKTVILGICAGYQMMTERIIDSQHVESVSAETPGLGIIPAETIFETNKKTLQVHGTVHNSNVKVRGYEIHHGLIDVKAHGFPFLSLVKNGTSQPEGYADYARNIFATSVHGLFDVPDFRKWFLNRIRHANGFSKQPASNFDVNDELQKLAAHVSASIDMEFFLKMAVNDD